jgi:LacI family transcriptional regulator, gluconate utilization system Gnt-I transcriptional repressor
MKKAKKKGADKKVTLVDVALAAGVSAITVSRVINQPEKVSEVLRRQVQKAVDSLGYIPNQHASSLASAKSNVIGVAIPSLSNIVFSDVLRGIYDVMGAAGYKVLLVDTHYSPLEEEKMIRTLLSQSPEGLIITGGGQTKNCHNILQKARIPIVQMMELLAEPIDMNVGFAHGRAGYDVVQHLLGQGYKRIGFIGARMDPRVQQRMQGYKLALEQQGKFDKNLMVTTPEPSSIELGGELFKSLMASTNGSIDAVFCVNDDLALGALFESQRMNIRVPQDMAICGFNDIEAAAFVNPSLTSVYVGRYAMGVKASEMIINVLNDKPMASKIVDLGYEIKKRQSSSLL